MRKTIFLGWLLSATAWTQPGMLLGKDMPGKSFRGPLPPPDAQQRQLAVRLRADVNHLAVDIGERNSRNAPRKLIQTRDWIRAQFQRAGYRVQAQDFQVGAQTFTNLECEVAGRSGRVVVVGAHYDSAEGCPAANDNGSGVASMLALARYFRNLKVKPELSIRFVAFANEEPPHFYHSSMGSLVYARLCQKRKDSISAMLSLETMGYYSDQGGSQKYPPLFSLAYPSTGNFIAFVGDLKSGPLVKQCVGSFRRHQSFPSEGAALPGELEGVGWSDHWSFWSIGVPALMVTDTAPFRYPFYHRAQDLPDQLDYSRLARVVQGLQGVITDLAR